ncbi:MAG TPA: hypothetical protein VG826_17920 [Pirellulales bacterium]|nr:hypothetical protein [Pirellulales bacterium]
MSRPREPSRRDQNEKAAGDSPRTVLAWYGPFFLLVFLVGCVQIEDPDIWWHLRTGQLIWEGGRLPRTDWFTYTNPDSPWIDLHWGFQLLAALLWKVGGAPALVITKSLFAAATFALAMLAGRRAWPAWQTVACWLPAVLIFSGRNQVRPEMFSLLILAGELAILFHARARPRLLWLLPPAQVIWINVHGLYILGLVLWGCFLAGEILRTVVRHEPAAGTQAGIPASHWVLVSFLMVGAAIVNPYGLDGALFPFTLLKRIEGADHAFYTQFSGEFRGMSEFLATYGWAGALRNLTTLTMLLLAVATGLSFVPRFLRAQFDLYRMLVFGLFAWLAWQANRNAVLFALVSATVLRANLGEWLEGRRDGRRRFSLGPVLTASFLGVLIFCVPFDLLSVTRPAEIPRLFGVGEIPRAFPHEAARFLGRDGMPRRCYALDEGAAAVYTFHNAPQRLVFADARLEVNTRETLERYLAIERQLMDGDERVFDALAEGAERGIDQEAEVPSLLISLRYLAANRELQHGLAKLKRFRRVYVDYVAVAFVEASQAEVLGLPEVTE